MYYAFSALDRGRERKEATRIWERKEGELWIIFRKFDEIYEQHMNYAINSWQYQEIREKKIKQLSEFFRPVPVAKSRNKS